MKFNYKIWCKLFNVLSAWWYIKFYDVFFIFFCCFTAAQSNTIYLCNAYNIFLNKTWNELDTRWPHDKIQDGGGNLHDLFSFKSFHICVKKPQDIIWVDRTFSSLKENSSWKSLCYQNTHENTTDFQSWSWTYVRLEMNDLSRVIVWCYWWTWTEVMYKDRQTFCLGLFISLLHKIGTCVVMQIPESYEIKWFHV